MKEVAQIKSLQYSMNTSWSPHVWLHVATCTTCLLASNDGWVDSWVMGGVLCMCPPLSNDYCVACNSVISLWFSYIIEEEKDAINLNEKGTKVAAHYFLNVPAGGEATVRLRICDDSCKSSIGKYSHFFFPLSFCCLKNQQPPLNFLVCLLSCSQTF